MRFRTMRTIMTLALGILLAPLAAEALGLTLPLSLLVFANEIIR